MLPTVSRARGNVDEPALRNYQHLIHVLMLATEERIPLLFAKKNQSLPKNLEKSKVAVETWDTKSAENFDTRNKNPLYKRSHKIAIGIPYGKLQNYINDDISKMYKLGVSVGRKIHLDTGDDIFVASFLIHADRGNNGMYQKYAIDLITYVISTFSLKQATNVLYRTFKNKHAGINIGRSGPGVNIHRHKLDAISFVKYESGLVNNPERLKRLKDQLQLDTSIEDILDYQAELEKDKMQNLQKDIQDMVVSADQKLNDKNGDASNITKIEIVSILCIRHKKEVTPSKHKKDVLVNTLQDSIARLQPVRASRLS